jgi:hypothetical protein
MEVGSVLDVAHALGGVAIACLRVSFADVRDRHQGLSHHSATALRLAARERALVAVPELPTEQSERLRSDLHAAEIDRRHELVAVPTPDALGLLERYGIEVVSMGRPAADDPALFQAAAAAGTLAARRVTGA